MEKFTKGEWVVNGMGSFPKSPNTICITVQLNEKREPLDVDEYLANAHIISAAPDMYRALRELISDVERAIYVEHGGTPWLKGKLAEIDYARAALAKANGEV